MLRLVTAASGRPVSLDDLKMIVEAADFDDDDEKLALFLDGAIAYVAQQTSLVLSPTEYRVERSCWWTDKLEILLTPVRDITAVGYLNVAGSLQTLDAEKYRWARTASGATITLLDTSGLPSIAQNRDDAVQISVEGGFDIDGATGSGDDPELVLPRQARNAIIMLAAHWYANREAALASELKEIPFGVEALIRQIMVYR